MWQNTIKKRLDVTEEKLTDYTILQPANGITISAFYNYHSIVAYYARISPHQRRVSQPTDDELALLFILFYYFFYFFILTTVRLDAAVKIYILRFLLARDRQFTRGTQKYANILWVTVS